MNSGKFYSYHMNGTNNKYWMTGEEIEETFKRAEEPKARMGSVSSMDSEDAKSRTDNENWTAGNRIEEILKRAEDPRARVQSVSSMASGDAKSRNNSISE